MDSLAAVELTGWTHPSTGSICALLLDSFIVDVVSFIGFARLYGVNPTNGAPSPYGTASLQREGDYWTLEFDGRVCRMRHAKGLAFLAELLAHPGNRVSALDLERLAETRRHPPDVGPDDEATVSWEKARLNVTRALRVLLKKIEAYHPSAAGHLGASIKTGKLCWYAPDPKLSIQWKVSTDPARRLAERELEPFQPSMEAVIQRPRERGI